MIKKLQLKTIDYVFMLLLFLTPFLHVAVGVDLTDSGYSLGNYENMQNMQGMWVVATFLSNSLGKGFTCLPGGHYWLVMNIYTSLLPALLGVTVYLYLRRYMYKWIVFIGEMMALLLCWCPHVIIYNYLTYVLFTVSVILVLNAIEKQKNSLFFVAGLVLGTSVFARFPNVVQAMLIVVVWYDCIIQKRGMKTFFARTGACIGGYITALLCWYGIISCIYGLDAYPKMIMSLTDMTKEATSYSANGMVSIILQAYKNAFFPFARVLLGTVAGLGIYSFLKRKWMKITFAICYIVAYGLFLVWAVRNWVFRPIYNDYVSILFFSTVFLMISITTAVVMIVKKQTSQWQKNLSVSVLVLIFVTPIGSNNGAYPAINHLFLVAPYTLFCLRQLLFQKKVGFQKEEGRVQWLPLRLCLLLTLACTFFQTLIFGVNFTFRDGGFMTKAVVRVEGNEVLSGMHTNRTSADELNEISQFVRSNQLQDSEAVFFGEVPSLSYILEIPCAISHTWPDLPSYTIDQMSEDMSRMEGAPLIIVGAKQYPAILESSAEGNVKRDMLVEYMEIKQYREIFRNESYVIYQTDTK